VRERREAWVCFGVRHHFCRCPGGCPEPSECLPTWLQACPKCPTHVESTWEAWGPIPTPPPRPLPPNTPPTAVNPRLTTTEGACHGVSTCWKWGGRRHTLGACMGGVAYARGRGGAKDEVRQHGSQGACQGMHPRHTSHRLSTLLNVGPYKNVS